MTKIFETPLYPYRRSADQDADSPVRHKVVVLGAGPVGLGGAVQPGTARSGTSRRGGCPHMVTAHTHTHNT